MSAPHDGIRSRTPAAGHGQGIGAGRGPQDRERAAPRAHQHRPGARVRARRRPAARHGMRSGPGSVRRDLRHAGHRRSERRAIAAIRPRMAWTGPRLRDRRRPTLAHCDTFLPILHTVIAERRALRADNPGGDPVQLGLPQPHPPARAFMAAPIASPAQVYGWLCLVRNEELAFTADDEQLIAALSGQVGRIYANGYLYSVARKRAENIEHEIAERQRARGGALRLERDRAERYLDTAAVILLRALDLDGRITLVNRYACSLLGWTAEELLGRSWVDTCLPPRIRATTERTLNKKDAGRRPTVSGREPHCHPAGGERLIEWRNTVLRDDAGCHRLFTSGTDITERSRVIEALRPPKSGCGSRSRRPTSVSGTWTTGPASQVVRDPRTPVRRAAGDIQDVRSVCRAHPPGRSRAMVETLGRRWSGTDFSVQHRSSPDGSVRWLTARAASSSASRPTTTRRRYLPRRHRTGRWRSSISRRRRWRRSDGWPAVWRTTSTIC